MDSSQIYYSGTYNPNAGNPLDTVTGATTDAVAAGQKVNAQLPGYGQDIAKVGANISSEVSGQLPADVIAQIQQGGAERGVGTGSPGSPNSNASYLQALGLNSLQLTNTGQTNLNAATAALPGAAISQNPSFYETPALDTSINQAAINRQTTATEQQQALSAAQAGAAAAGVAPPSGGALPPTPPLGAGFGAVPTGGGIGPYGGGAGAAYGSGTGADQTATLLNDIQNTYGGLFNGGDGTPESGTDDATGGAFNPQPDEGGDYAQYDG